MPERPRSLAEPLEPFRRALVDLGDPDVADLPDLLAEHRLEVVPFREKAMLRDRLPLETSDLVIGRLPSTRFALRRLIGDVPAPSDYPEELRPFMGRRVWTATAASVRDALEQGEGPLFVKPRDRLKRFTGQVVTYPWEGPLPAMGARQVLWCSEVVEWRSEHRVFVARSEILDVRHYWGDGAVVPDPDVIRACLHALSATAPAGFALDVGVLADHSTAVVEQNDGFALGRYGLDARRYVELLARRWAELVAGDET